MSLISTPSQLPDPEKFTDLRSWAKELTAYFQRERVTGLLQKDPLLLQHQVANVLSRATVDGILMFDPVAKSPVVSVDGIWQLLISGTVSTFYVGSVDVTGALGSVTFPAPFSTPPYVLLTPAIAVGSNETYSATVETYDEAGFDCALTVIDNAYGTPVRPATGLVNWLACL